MLPSPISAILLSIASHCISIDHSASRSLTELAGQSTFLSERIYLSVPHAVAVSVGLTAVAVQVLGVIMEKGGENFKVDIGTATPAVLSTLAFDGATKRNRPNLKVSLAQRLRYQFQPIAFTKPATLVSSQDHLIKSQNHLFSPQDPLFDTPWLGLSIACVRNGSATQSVCQSSTSLIVFGE